MPGRDALSVAIARRGLVVAFVAGLGISITLAETALALLALLWLRKLGDVHARRSVPRPLWLPVLAFSAASLVSALASGHPGASLLAGKGLLLAAALYVTADMLDSAKRAEQFLSGLALAAGLAAVVGLLQVTFCPGDLPDYGAPGWLYHRCARARGFFSIYMTLAGVLNLALLATLPRLLLRTGSRWLPPVWLIQLIGLAATYTRGAWLGFASGVLALVPIMRKQLWSLVIGLLVLALAAVAGPHHLRHRVLTMGDPDDPTVKERIYMWHSGIAMWRDHPWLGVGPGGVKRDYHTYALAGAIKQRTGHVHNTPLQILVERGVVGLLAWGWIWAAFGVHALRRLRDLPATARRERALVAGSLAAIVGFLVAGISEYNFGDSEVVMVAWAVMAVPFTVARGSR